MWLFGFPLFIFPAESGIGFSLFHGLDWTGILLIIGVGLALWRRVTDSGLLATQRFSYDLVPLILLFAIAVTGLLLTASQMWWEGQFYWFLSLLHQVTVVMWFLSIPFGKFFHVVQRPASVGVTLYQTVNQDVEHYGAQTQTGRCKRCNQALPSQQFVNDLKATLNDLHQNYDLGADRGALQNYCPTCKRVLRGQAYYQMMGN